MSELAGRLVMALLVLIHLFLFAWAAAGIVEWLLPTAPWPSLENPLFPQWLLALQWLSILATASAFLVGYALRWRALPIAIAVGYAVMASVCAVETIGFLRHDLRYLAMALEYTAYVLILIFLFRSRFARRRFGAPERYGAAAAGPAVPS